MMPNLAENSFVRLEGMQVSIGRATEPDRMHALLDIVIYSRPAPGTFESFKRTEGNYSKVNGC